MTLFVTAMTYFFDYKFLPLYHDFVSLSNEFVLSTVTLVLKITTLFYSAASVFCISAQIFPLNNDFYLFPITTSFFFQLAHFLVLEWFHSHSCDFFHSFQLLSFLSRACALRKQLYSLNYKFLCTLSWLCFFQLEFIHLQINTLPVCIDFLLSLEITFADFQKMVYPSTVKLCFFQLKL